MNLIQNTNVKNKMIIMALVELIFLLVIGLTGIYYLRLSNHNSDTMYQDRLLAIQYLEEAKNAYNAENTSIFEIMITRDPSRNGLLKTQIETKKKDLQEYMDKYANTSLDAQEKKILNELQGYRTEAEKNKSNVLVLAASNKNEQAYKLYNEKVSDLNHKIETNLNDLTQYNTRVASQLNDENEADYARTVLIISVLILLSLVVVSFISITITAAIVKPIRFFERYVEKVANGDLSAETLADEKDVRLYQDEIGSLGRSIEIMRDRLWTVLSKVSESAELIASASEELSASAQESLSNIEETTNSVNTIALGTENQLNMVGDTSQTVKQISGNIRQTSDKSSTTAKVAEQALHATTEGDKAIGVTREQMKHIEDTVSQLDKMVSVLGDKSNEIGSIVETISGIAEQTNLLSLNAAIEAARAGDQGKGFAVVAEEVRKLAEDSRISTGKIEGLIEEIQTMTGNAVMSMNEGSGQVKIGMEVVDKAGRSFDEISGLVHTMTNQIQDISAASENIAEGSSKIVTDMGQVDIISKEVSEQSATIAASMEEQTASMHEISKASESLARIGTEMMAEITKFKL